MIALIVYRDEIVEWSLCLLGELGALTLFTELLASEETRYLEEYFFLHYFCDTVSASADFLHNCLFASG